MIFLFDYNLNSSELTNEKKSMINIIDSNDNQNSACWDSNVGNDKKNDNFLKTILEFFEKKDHSSLMMIRVDRFFFVQKQKSKKINNHLLDYVTF